MANAICTLTIMPSSPEVDLAALEKKALGEITSFNNNKDTKVEVKPVAFGLHSVNIIFVLDESKGSPDPVAEKISEFEEVNSAEITDVRRALG